MLKFVVLLGCLVVLIFTIYNFVMIFKDLKRRRINKKKENKKE